jgi:hypothetical protein
MSFQKKSEVIDCIFKGDLFSNEKFSDIAFDDFGHRWESLRRVAHSAVRFPSSLIFWSQLIPSLV